LNLSPCGKKISVGRKRESNALRVWGRTGHLATRNKRWVENVMTLTEHVQHILPTVGGQILTALTHGDFQPGNILVDGDRVWLIDWEYSARRQVGYDALVYALCSRFPSPLTGVHCPGARRWRLNRGTCLARDVLAGRG